MDRISQAREFLANGNNDPTGLGPHLRTGRKAYARTLAGLLDCPDKRARNRAAKLLVDLSASEPNSVYPLIDELVIRVGSDDTIVQWNAIASIGLLAGVDRDGTIDGRLPALFELLRNKSMITAGHAIVALGRIAGEKPHLRSRILDRLLKVDAIPRNPECREILAGKVLTALSSLGPGSAPTEIRRIRSFASKYQDSPRKAVRTAAVRAGKSHSGR